MQNEDNDNVTAARRPRYAVTGAAGFVGGRLVSRLLDAGHSVVAVTRDQGSGEALQALGAETRVADVRNPQQLQEAFDGADGVFHVAALFNHPDHGWDDYRDVNVTGTVNVLQAAQSAGVKKVVHTSTIGVATEAKPPPYDEETPYSPQPDDKYEVSKTEGEIAARKFAEENGLRLTVIRPAQVYGPGDRSKAKFYKLVKKGVIVNPGDTQKHLIYIDDLCDAFLKAMQSEVADGEVFVIAGKQPTKLTRLVELAAAELDVPLPRVKLPAKPVVLACTVVEKVCDTLRVKPVIFRRSMDFFTRTVECDTTKARRILGFESQVAVQDGVRETVSWLRQQQLI
jgi:nucleoside-diphosphate-sugar epimerase